MFLYCLLFVGLLNQQIAQSLQLGWYALWVLVSREFVGNALLCFFIYLLFILNQNYKAKLTPFILLLLLIICCWISYYFLPVLKNQQRTSMLSASKSLTAVTSLLKGPGLLHGTGFLLFFFSSSGVKSVFFWKLNFLFKKTGKDAKANLFFVFFLFFVLATGGYWANFSSVWGRWFNEDIIELVSITYLAILVLVLHNKYNPARLITAVSTIFIFYEVLLIRFSLTKSRHSSYFFIITEFLNLKTTITTTVLTLFFFLIKTHSSKMKFCFGNQLETGTYIFFILFLWLFLTKFLLLTNAILFFPKNVVILWLVVLTVIFFIKEIFRFPKTRYAAHHLISLNFFILFFLTLDSGLLVFKKIKTNCMFFVTTTQLCFYYNNTKEIFSNTTSVYLAAVNPQNTVLKFPRLHYTDVNINTPPTWKLQKFKKESHLNYSLKPIKKTPKNAHSFYETCTSLGYRQPEGKNLQDFKNFEKKSTDLIFQVIAQFCACLLCCCCCAIVY